MQPKVYEWKLDRAFLATMYRDIINTGTWTYNRAKARAGRGKDDSIPDLFDAMMSAKDHKHGLQYKMKDLWIESMLLLAAGMPPAPPPPQTPPAVASPSIRSGGKRELR